MVKYIGMGLPKTATRSLRSAFHILGYKVKGGLIHRRDLKTYDFINDGLMCLEYESFYKKIPGLKLIYTTREYDTWISSCRHRFSGYRKSVGRFKIFGSYTFNKNMWKKVYNDHAKKAEEFIQNHKEDVLILPLELENEKKWEKICEFTGNPVPDEEYPWRGQRG